MAKTNTALWVGIAIAALFVFGIVSIPEMALFKHETATTTKPLFDLKFLSPPTKAVASADLSWQVEVKNIGAAGTLFVDSGLYSAKQLEGFYGSPVNTLFALQTNVEDVKTCQPETFVDNKQVTLAAGAVTTVTFHITAPKEGTYYINAGSFERCWEKQGDEGYRTGRISRDPVIVSTKKIVTGDDCTSDATTKCSDGTTVITAQCVGGKLASTGNWCSEEKPFNVKEWWDSLGIIKWIAIVFIGVLLIAVLFPQQKTE